MDVGLIGTGLMGLPLGMRVVNAGLPLVAYNRTAEKLEPLRELGAAIAATPEIVLSASEVVVLMLTNATAIRETILSDAGRSQLRGRTIIQMGTIAPAESRAIQAEVEAAGGEYLEAPVLGSIPEAQTGQLIVMVGSTPTQFAAWLDLLQQFGPDPKLIGPVGSAAALKLALNQLIGSLTTAFAASLGLVMAEGIAVEQFMAILRTSALYAPTFDKKLSRMVEHHYANPNFPTKHLLKDMQLFQTAAHPHHIDTSTITAICQILTHALELGLADADYSALFDAVAKP